MTFAHAVTTFFTAYLSVERGLAKNTIASYSDTVRLLIDFACDRLGTKPDALHIEQLDRELILAFLDHLESTRRNAAATRNQRLAAIKTFFRFLARSMPELMQLSATVQAIAQKNTAHQPPPSLTEDEVQAILAVPDPGRLLGARDKAMLLLFYNSGARVQEVADLRPEHADRAAAVVTLTGKGGKTRSVPLWLQTCQAIGHWLALREHSAVSSQRLFSDAAGRPLTRFGIGRRVAQLAGRAADACPSLCGRTVTPHVLRHTTALHLVESGVDIAIVKDWLGHADLQTTSAYLEVSLRRKREALAKAPPPYAGPAPEPPRWKEPAIMDFLVRLSRGVMLPETKRRPKKQIWEPTSRNITSSST